MPQRFHMGDVPRLGGAALLAGMAASWALGLPSPLRTLVRVHLRQPADRGTPNGYRPA